ncbi:universal stress protein [Actinoplanes sp. N902-109]|uniref:universal stress protein n=1 Tax=Actinoplanes sp. (strain N902-109) TaxID=649831 RepID=UPI0003293949|nr:universal stress protein [Actinoplanes sp. N902-109]AGL16931.1 hypothetical protein L083_3421 [Actinoplanes sp. N902-109]
MARTDVVVGTDGTVAGAAAVQWAAREAGRRGAPLRIVHVFDWDYDELHSDCTGGRADVARQIAETVVRAAVRQARTAAPGVEVEGDVLTGDAGAHLIELSGTVALVVTGTHRRSTLSGLLRGSVSMRLATHAGCPVVVVRGPGTPGTGPVVVGVHDPARSDALLRAGYEAAELYGCGLRVVHSFIPVSTPWAVPGAPAADDEAERALLTRALAPWQERHPLVLTTMTLSHLPAAAALESASRGAGLVVVGSRGHGAIAGTLLGSTALHLMRHAGCAVAVVRPHRPALQDLRP